MAPPFADVAAVGIAAWCVFSVSAYALAVAWFLAWSDSRKAVSWTSLRSQLSYALARCRSALRSWRASEQIPIDVAVYKLARQRISGLCKFANVGWAPMQFISIIFVVGGAFDLFPSENKDHLAVTHIAASAVIPALAALSIVFENQPNKGAMAVATIICFSSLVLTLHSYQNGVEMLVDRFSVFGTRVALAMAVCDLRLTILCNTTYSALAIHKFLEFAPNEEYIAQFGFYKYFFQELVGLVGVCICHGVLLWRFETEARATIEARLSTSSIAQMKKVLATEYDVVAELNHDLAFADDAKDLAGVLLHDPHRSLKGSHIADLMVYDADKEAFSTHVTHLSSESASQCCALPHVFHMRDTCSNVLSMEMWHICFEGLDSRLRHIIAIKELAHHEQREGQDGAPSSEPFVQVSSSVKVRSGRKQTRTDSAAKVSDEQQPREGQIVQEPRQPHAHQGHAQTQGHTSSRKHREESDASHASSNASDRSRSYVVQGCGPTSAQAQKTSMLHLLTSWNTSVRRTHCCAYHALTLEASKTAKWLAGAGCREWSVNQFAKWQCPNCGIIAPSSEIVNFDPRSCRCYYCGCDCAATCRLVAM